MAKITTIKACDECGGRAVAEIASPFLFDVAIDIDNPQRKCLKVFNTAHLAIVVLKSIHSSIFHCTDCGYIFDARQLNVGAINKLLKTAYPSDSSIIS